MSFKISINFSFATSCHERHKCTFQTIRLWGPVEFSSLCAGFLPGLSYHSTLLSTSVCLQRNPHSLPSVDFHLRWALPVGAPAKVFPMRTAFSWSQNRHCTLRVPYHRRAIATIAAPPARTAFLLDSMGLLQGARFKCARIQWKQTRPQMFERKLYFKQLLNLES